MSGPQSEAKSTFVFKDWCEQHELDSHTVTTLTEEKLDVASALETLSREDICSLELPLGQRNLVMKGVGFLTGRYAQTHSLGATSDTLPTTKNTRQKRRIKCTGEVDAGSATERPPNTE